MKHRTGAGWILVLAMISLAGAGFQSSADLFQKALRLERSEGDLKGALAVYKQIVEKNEDEALAAQAQFRLGVCLEKLGRAEARAAFQLVVDRYPRQTETVREAREKISAMAGAENARPGIPSDFSLRRIWSDPGIIRSSRVSPDGRFIAFQPAGTGNLALRDLQTGKTRMIRESFPKKNLPDNEGRELLMSMAWSSDGTRLAYLWGEWYRAASPPKAFPELYLYNVSSNTSELLHFHEKLNLESLMNWTADDSKILVRAIDRFPRTLIGFFSLKDGKFTPVYAKQNSTYRFRTSPDGEWLAAVINENGSEYSLSFISVDSGKLDAPVLRSSTIRPIGWTAEGDRFLFLSDKLNGLGLWAVPMKDGMPAGEPEMIRSDIGDVDPLGLTLKEEIYFATRELKMGLHSFCVDFTAGRLSEPERMISRPFEECDGFFDLSPDGRSLAYMVMNGGATMGGKRDIGYICVYSFDDGRRRDFDINERVGAATVKWLDKSTLQLLIAFSGEVLYKNLDLNSGEWTRGSSSEKAPMGDSPKNYLSPNGVFEYRVQSERISRDTRSALLRIHRTSGEEKEICSFSGTGGWHIYLSPDRRTLALADGQLENEKRIEIPRKITFIHLDEGVPRETFLDADDGLSSLSSIWTADSKGLITAQVSRQPNGPPYYRTSFWIVTREGKTARKVITYLTDSGIIGAFFKTDGQRVVYRKNRDIQGELWIMENALKSRR